MMAILLTFIYGIGLSRALFCLFTNPCDKTGLENNEGKCVEYDCGGTSGVHYYVCCNNWDDIPPTPPICDKETYDSASGEDYCGTKGGNKGGGCRNSKLFDCGDCVLQEWIATRCHSRLNSIPGFCWHFTSCFEKECNFWTPVYKIIKDSGLFTVSWTHLVADSGIHYSCGDGICDQDENIENCAMDCCSSINSQCSFDPNVVASHCEIEINDNPIISDEILQKIDNQCGLSCCGDDECCFDDNNGGITPTPLMVINLDPTYGHSSECLATHSPNCFSIPSDPGYQCDFSNHELIALKAQFMKEAIAASTDYPIASQNLMHYLVGSGNQIDIGVDKLLQFDAVKDLIQKNVESIVCDSTNSVKYHGSHLAVSAKWEGELCRCDSERASIFSERDLFLGSGTFTIGSSAYVCIERISSDIIQFEMKITHTFFDYYDWDPTSILPRGLDVYEQLYCLQAAGMAKNYVLQTTWKDYESGEIELGLFFDTCWTKKVVDICTPKPTEHPTSDPTNHPTKSPTNDPTTDPTKSPTNSPTTDPTKSPTIDPSADPSADPTTDPITDPTKDPTTDPTKSPTTDPTKGPTTDPTKSPTTDPSADPITDPTKDPTTDPTKSPTTDPTKGPTTDPTKGPTTDPTKGPTTDPTKGPTTDPTNSPTNDPTKSPEQNVTSDPSSVPTTDPTWNPTLDPTNCCDELVSERPELLQSLCRDVLFSAHDAPKVLVDDIDADYNHHDNDNDMNHMMDDWNYLFVTDFKWIIMIFMVFMVFMICTMCVVVYMVRQNNKRDAYRLVDKDIEDNI